MEKVFPCFCQGFPLGCGDQRAWGAIEWTPSNGSLVGGVQALPSRLYGNPQGPPGGLWISGRRSSHPLATQELLLVLNVGMSLEISFAHEPVPTVSFILDTLKKWGATGVGAPAENLSLLPSHHVHGSPPPTTPASGPRNVSGLHRHILPTYKFTSLKVISINLKRKTKWILFSCIFCKTLKEKNFVYFQQIIILFLWNETYEGWPCKISLSLSCLVI